MKRGLIVFLFCAVAMQAAPVLLSVEFPYKWFPRQLWDRELAWMKNAGIQNVALSVHSSGDEADVFAILRTLRRLQITAWVRLEGDGTKLESALETQLQSHGGPIAYLNNDAPQPVTKLSAISAAAQVQSRAALVSKHGTLLWSDVEDTLRPEFHKGAISFAGDELPSLSALRRDALLVRYWSAGLTGLTVTKDVHLVTGALPLGVSARQVMSPAATGESGVSVTNQSKTPFRGDLRVFYPPAKRSVVLPGVQVPAGDSLWLPVNVPLAKGPYCRNCDAFGKEDSVVYATAELISAEYENGILALEFTAPVAGTVVLHLSKEPSGPLVAAGKPQGFDWDASTNRARIAVPAGRGPAQRVRIGLGMEPPDHSAFFGDTKVLIIGQKNSVPTTYSSEELAKRSRLRAPVGLPFEAVVKSPLEIDYQITVPADALHGDHLELALEADGVQMGHTRLQLLRAASLRIREAINRHFGSAAELPVSPALVAVDQRAGRNLNITLRNNFPEIRSYVLDLSGAGLEFSPAHAEITLAASSERDVSVRVFPGDGPAGLRGAVLKLSGAAVVDLPVQFAVIPRGESIAYTADGQYILESQKARAVFSNSNGDRWLEFVWKDAERNVLPDAGIELGPAARKLQLRDAELSIEQEAALPPESLKAGKYGDVTLQVQRGANRVVYLLGR